MSSPTTPPLGTVTTLRAPKKAALIGRRGPESEERGRRLMAQQYLPFAVEGAEEGLQLLRQRKFDLVVLDVDAPGMGCTPFLEARAVGDRAVYSNDPDRTSYPEVLEMQMLMSSIAGSALVRSAIGRCTSPTPD